MESSVRIAAEDDVRHQASTLLAVLALLLPMAAAQARAERIEKRDPGMRWFTDLDQAIEEAKARNIPLFVAYHKDH